MSNVNHTADRIRAKLVLRLVRACVQADLLETFGFASWDGFILELNLSSELRRTVLSHADVIAALEPLDSYVQH